MASSEASLSTNRYPQSHRIRTSIWEVPEDSPQDPQDWPGILHLQGGNGRSSENTWRDATQYLAADCGWEHLALYSKSFANHLKITTISCCARNSLKIMSGDDDICFYWILPKPLSLASVVVVLLGHEDPGSLIIWAWQAISCSWRSDSGPCIRFLFGHREVKLEETGKLGYWATWYDFHWPLL